MANLNSVFNAVDKLKLHVSNYVKVARDLDAKIQTIMDALDLNGRAPSTPINNDLLLDAKGYLTLSAVGVAADFAPDLTAQQQMTITATQGPISAPNGLGVKVSQVAWKSLPSWYIVSSNDRVISPTLEMTMAK